MFLSGDLISDYSVEWHQLHLPQHEFGEEDAYYTILKIVIVKYTLNKNTGLNQSDINQVFVFIYG